MTYLLINEVITMDAEIREILNKPLDVVPIAYQWWSKSGFQCGLRATVMPQTQVKTPTNTYNALPNGQ